MSRKPSPTTDQTPRQSAAEPTGQLPPRSGAKPRLDIMQIAGIVNRRKAHDMTTANTVAVQVYNMNASFPLLSFLEAWKDGTIGCEAWFVLSVIKAYRLLTEQHGVRPGDNL